MLIKNTYREYLRCSAFVNAHLDYTKSYEKENTLHKGKIYSSFSFFSSFNFL